MHEQDRARNAEGLGFDEEPAFVETSEHTEGAAAPSLETADESSLSRRKRAPLVPGLYVVATPIGNLEDMTLRALRVLREADRIGCEDTRQTQKLLHAFGIRTPTVSYHRHNEHARSEELLEQLRAGERIAIVSDAGTPGLADPGAELIARAIEADVPVFVVPGASALLAAVTGSGMAPAATGAFRFHSFLPPRSGERRSVLERVRAEAGAQLEVFFEAPHRLLDALADIEAVFGPAQPIGLARELTKIHEEFLRGTVAQLRARLTERPSIRGEIVLLLPPRDTTVESAPGAERQQDLRQEIESLMRDGGLTEMEAIKRVAKRRRLGKSEVYREWQRGAKS